MGVGVHVNLAVAVAMGVEMHAVAQQATQHVEAQSHQHHADEQFHASGHGIRNRGAEHDHEAAQQEQRQAVSDAPHGTVADYLAHRPRARREAGDGGDVIHLEGMLHTDQQAKQENRCHVLCPQDRSFDPDIPSDQSCRSPADRQARLLTRRRPC